VRRRYFPYLNVFLILQGIIMGKHYCLDILLVEDKEIVRNALKSMLRKAGYAVEAAQNGQMAMNRLNERFFDLVITDYKMEPIDGMELLRQVKSNWPATEVIMITAYGTISSGVEAIKLGAFDYITKPFQHEELLGIIERLVEKRQNGQTLRYLKSQVRKHSEFNAIIGQSDTILNLLALVSHVAGTDSTVLITGESGTGKELIAKAIHDASHRRDRPFVTIHCGAIPENLQESELFGHAKGAFTGADFEKKGLFETGDGGTIFLDEVAETSPMTQVKLLRFLQNNEFRRIGETHSNRVDIRLIVATNKDLELQVKKGKFREDLFYRINVIPLTVPPLRERKEDIPLLVSHFIEKYGNKNGKWVTQISKRALCMLINYDWPGNVRELENVIQRAVALTVAEDIIPEVLPANVRQKKGLGGVGLNRHTSKLSEIENEVILETLKRLNGNKQKTAQELGISKSTLWRKLKYLTV
jgi:DNA-binding NtrC family response regulator